MRGLILNCGVNGGHLCLNCSAWIALLELLCLNCSTPLKVWIFVLQLLFNACCNLGSMTIHPLTNRMQQNFWVASEANTSWDMFGDRSPTATKHAWPIPLKTEVHSLQPLLLRIPEEKKCNLQILINIGHYQEPYTNACIHAHLCIVLQFERFPGLALKRNTPINFFRAKVHIPVFNNITNKDINWLQYRMIIILRIILITAIINVFFSARKTPN